MFSILSCQMTGVPWYKQHDLVSGDTSGLIAHIGTRHKVQEHGILGRERSHGDTRARAVEALEPCEPLTCGLLPLLIEKICRAYGGAGGEPLQPRPGFKICLGLYSKVHVRGDSLYVAELLLGFICIANGLIFWLPASTGPTVKNTEQW